MSKAPSPRIAPGIALVTGSAGFIGYHLCARLLAAGWQVRGFDALTPYYDPALKRARHGILAAHPGFTAYEAALETPGAVRAAAEGADLIVHLAAQAGVRYSIEAPESYVSANLIGTAQLLEAARAVQPRHLLIASTSSVYGASPNMPYRETDPTDRPLSFYAATKKAGEAMAHSYAHLYGIPTSALRFFTVYGPWGRPDMALFRFAKAILEGGEVPLYNGGDMRRDFTYVDDLTEALMRLIGQVPGRAPLGPEDSLSPEAPYRVINIGSGRPIPLQDFLTAIETAAGRKARVKALPMQAGDVPATWASTALLERLIGPWPRTDLATGVGAFFDWYRGYYGGAASST